MGSPPRDLAHLMRTSICKESTPFSSKQSFCRVDHKARFASMGPHSGLVGRLQAVERRDRLTKVPIPSYI